MVTTSLRERMAWECRGTSGNRTIAKSGRFATKAGDSLVGTESAGPGPQRQGHWLWKPSLLAQDIQADIHQYGEDFTQSGTPPGMAVFAPTVVFDVMPAVFNAPMTAKQAEPVSRAATPSGREAAQQIPTLLRQLAGGQGQVGFRHPPKADRLARSMRIFDQSRPIHPGGSRPVRDWSKIALAQSRRGTTWPAFFAGCPPKADGPAPSRRWETRWSGRPEPRAGSL